MKRRTLFLGLVLCLILSLAIAGCSVSGSSNVSSSSSVEHVEAQLKIQDIYALYAANAEQTGETPLSYEEWLASVKGEDGKDGANGLSAYEIWLANGYSGTQGDFLNWIKGQDGAPGKDGQDGQDGKDGLSAYQIWLNAGHTGSEQDFLNWLKGEKGDQGEPGKDGKDGQDGQNGVGIEKIEKISTVENVDTYQITLTDKTTYTFTVTNGINGSNGEDGAPGKDGEDGQDGAPGQDGEDGKDGQDGVSVTTAKINENGELLLYFSNGNYINVGKVVGDSCDCSNGGSGSVSNPVIKNVYFDANGNLIIEYGDGSNKNLGKAPICTHSLSSWEIISNETCVSVGVKTRSCSLCGFKDYDFTPATGVHSYGDYVDLVSTCTQKVKARYCSGCGASELVTETGSWHNYSSSVIAPTCAEQGYTLHECSVCGNSYKNNYTEKSEQHTLQELYAIVSTCSERKVLKTCLICNKNTVETEDPIAEHSYSEMVTNPTCTEQGYTIYTCNACGYSYTGSYVDSLGGTHNYENGVCTICGQEMPKWDGTIATEFAGGSGTESDPYLISTGAQLAYLANGINSSDSNKLYDKHYLLLNDINLNGLEWDPIGSYYINSSSGSDNRTFQGLFNGNGYVISNFKITQPRHSDYERAGLFGINSGTIKNVGVENFVIDVTESGATVGGLVGWNDGRGIISNCYATGDVSATATSSDDRTYVGGLIGSNSGTISNCYATGDVSATTHNGYEAYAGGLIGWNEGTIIKCYATGDVSATTTLYAYEVNAGGLIGENWGTLKNCYATGNVSATSNKYSPNAGGLIGHNWKTSIIFDCYATGNVSAISEDGSACAGGLIGDNWGTLKNCYATGDVSATIHNGNSAYAGGLIGWNEGTISNCYATGNVSATSSKYIPSAGGLVGYNGGAIIADCYRYEGQIITLDHKGTVTNTPSKILGTACTLEQLNSKSFYTETLLWDETIWNFVELDFEKGKYPTLIGE